MVWEEGYGWCVKRLAGIMWNVWVLFDKYTCIGCSSEVMDGNFVVRCYRKGAKIKERESRKDASVCTKLGGVGLRASRGAGWGGLWI